MPTALKQTAQGVRDLDDYKHVGSWRINRHTGGAVGLSRTVQVYVHVPPERVDQFTACMLDAVYVFGLWIPALDDDLFAVIAVLLQEPPDLNNGSVVRRIVAAATAEQARRRAA